MSDSSKDAAGAANPAGLDPATLMSLYSMQYAGLGGFGLSGMVSSAASTSSPSSSPITVPSAASATTTSTSNSTLGVAASQAASLGMNQASAAWWNMASQLAAQDYLTRLQAASRDPAAYAALASQGVLPNYEMLASGSKSRSNSASKSGKSSRTSSPSASASAYSRATGSPSMLDSLKLPSDTEIIKYTSSSTGPKVPGTTNRGRKKTISLDQTAMLLNAAASAREAAAPSIPSGLTIERKQKTGNGRSSAARQTLDDVINSAVVDRVEITKVPVSSSNGRARDFSFPKTDDVSLTLAPVSGTSTSTGESPLNLSMKSSSAATVTSASSGSDLLRSLASASGKIPSDYYASQALSGAFLAEQIRQQQLAAALENRLNNQHLTQEDSNSATAAAAQAASSSLMQTLLMNKLSGAGIGVTPSETSKLLAIAAAAAQNGTADKSARVVRESKNGRGAARVEPKKGTVASMLAASKEKSRLTPEELEAAEKSIGAHPELTIEPIFRSLKPDASVDLSSESRLHIKNVADSPEIRDQYGEHDDQDARNSAGKYATVETGELRNPLRMGWKRETIVREYCKSGVRGDVCYYAPCGKKFKQYPDIVRYLEKNGLNNTLSRDHFSFSTRIFIGDFYKPTGMMENGEEKYIQLNEEEMIADVDKIRRENGWKPIKRGNDVQNPTSLSTASVTVTPTSTKSSKKSKAAESRAAKEQASAALAALAATLTPEQKLMLHLQEEMKNLSAQGMSAADQAKIQKEALKYLREAEKLKKMDQARQEKEARQQKLLAEKAERQRKQDEIIRQRQEENLKKEQKRQMQEQEREKRRQHMILMRQLEGKKRNDEREKKRSELIIEKEKEKERKIEQKRLENEIMVEMRKPQEDMSLSDSKPLPEHKRMKGMRLSSEAFANVLMVYEFLHNFGHRLGFDMDSLPTMSELQAALMNDSEAEEELLSVLIHLLVCAIDDPGIPTPYKHLTLLGQNLRTADITNTNVSEILKIYLNARAQVEVKNLHGIVPPDTHSIKDRHREIPYDKKKMADYEAVVVKTRPYELSMMVKERPFQCLNPTDKSEILAFVCNELLTSKNIVHQIDASVESVSKAKKIKMLLETKVKKLKLIHNRKFKQAMYNSALKHENLNGGDDSVTNQSATNLESETASEVASTVEDDSMSVMSEATSEATPKKKGVKRGRGGPGRGKKGAVAVKKKVDTKKKKKEVEEEEEDEEEEEEEEEESDADVDDLEDDGEDDEKLTQEELLKKIEKTVKQLAKKREECVHLNNCMRVTDLGQDRYRRRYWHFAHAGGVLVESMESAEPWKQIEKDPEVKKEEDEEEEEEIDDDEPEIKRPKMLMNGHHDEEKENTTPLMEIDDREEADQPANLSTANGKEETDEERKKRVETEEALKKLGSDILVTPKVDEDEKKFTPKVTPNADKLNLFNHSAHFNMTLSPVVLNGAVTITPKSESQAWTSSPMPSATGLHPPPIPLASNSQYGIPCDRPWFSLLPLNGPKDNAAKFMGIKSEGFATPDKTKALLQAQCPVNPQLALLELKLDQVKKFNADKERKPIPEVISRGWWHITDPSDIVQLEAALNFRGTREQQLLANIRRSMDFCFEEKDPKKNIFAMPATAQNPEPEPAPKKPLAEEIDFEDIEDLEDPELMPGGAPKANDPDSWSEDVCLRVEKYILEQVEALEDKVASASMQVPGWKLPNRPDIDARKFRPSCLPKSGPKDDRDDPIAEAKTRLLDLEENIERRYLKAPLGNSNTEVNLTTITSSSTPAGRSTSNSNSTPVSRRTTNISLNISKELSETKEDATKDGEENGEDESDEAEEEEPATDSPSKTKCNLPKGLVAWREGVRKAQTAAQLAMTFYVLETSIAWHKSIMKAFCQLCHCGDDEDSLLLCDGCDKGYHMYCFKPELKQVPEGDWYCYECINKATSTRHCLVCGKQNGKNMVPCTTCPRAYHTDCLSPSLSKVPRGRWQCPGCNQKTPKKRVPKKLRIMVGTPEESNDSIPSVRNSVDTDSNHATSNGNGKEESKPAKEEKLDRKRKEKEDKEDAKDKKKKKGKGKEKEKEEEEEEEEEVKPPPEKKPKKEKPPKETAKSKKEAKAQAKLDKELSLCMILVTELEDCDDAWPFLFPVNSKQFPTYKKIIKNPIDIDTIKKRLESGSYRGKEDFRKDMRLIFANCEIFNEDDSPVGKAGHAMKMLFDTRWVELMGASAESK